MTAAVGTAITPAFADLTTAIPVVGSAFLGVLALLVTWKLVRGAFA